MAKKEGYNPAPEGKEPRPTPPPPPPPKGAEKLKKRIGENVESVWVNLEVNPNINKQDPYERKKFCAGISISKDGKTKVEDLFQFAWETTKGELNSQIREAQEFQAKKGQDYQRHVQNNVKSNGSKSSDNPATEAQIIMITRLREAKGVKEKDMPKTIKEASDEIDKLQKLGNNSVETKDAKF